MNVEIMLNLDKYITKKSSDHPTVGKIKCFKASTNRISPAPPTQTATFSLNRPPGRFSV